MQYPPHCTYTCTYAVHIASTGTIATNFKTARLCGTAVGSYDLNWDVSGHRSRSGGFVYLLKRFYTAHAPYQSYGSTGIYVRGSFCYIPNFHIFTHAVRWRFMGWLSLQVLWE